MAILQEYVSSLSQLITARNTFVEELEARNPKNSNVSEKIEAQKEIIQEEENTKRLKSERLSTK